MIPPSPPRRSSLNRRGVIVLVIALVLSIVVVGVASGEVYMRHKIKDCIATQFANVGTDVDVGLSSKPVLLQLLGGKLDYVTLETKPSESGTVQGMTIDAKINGIDTSTGATDSSKAIVTWSADGILATLQQQSFGQLIQSVQTNSDGTLHVAFAANLATATIQVYVENGSLKLKTVDASFLGLGIGNGVVDNVLTTINDNLSNGNLPFGLKAKSVAMDSKGLTLELAGENFVPSAAPPTATTTPSTTGTSPQLAPEAPRKVTC